jgi:hypothetical protein
MYGVWGGVGPTPDPVEQLMDEHVRALAKTSNLTEKCFRLLGATVAERRLNSSDIVGVSDVRGSLLVVCKSGHVLANETGIFNRRIDIEGFVPYEPIDRLIEAQGGYSKAPESMLEAEDANGRTLFRLNWGIGIGAVQERDRVLQIMLGATRAPAPVPLSSVPPFSSQMIKDKYLSAWAQDLFRAAGIIPSEDLVAEHANMAAAWLIQTVLVPFARRNGVPDFDPWDNISRAEASESQQPHLAAFLNVYLDLLGQMCDLHHITRDHDDPVRQSAVTRFVRELDVDCDREMDECWREYLQGINDSFAHGEFGDRASKPS